jgi:hypothetical protein
VLAGHVEKAKVAMERLLQIDPMLCVHNLKDQFTFRRAEDMIRLADGLRRAGLPE